MMKIAIINSGTAQIALHMGNILIESKIHPKVATIIPATNAITIRMILSLLKSIM